MIKQDKEWGFIPKSCEGGRELRDRQHPVKEQDRSPMLHSTAEPQAKAPFVSSQLCQFGCFSTKQLERKHTSLRGKPLRIEKSLPLSNPGAIRDKDRDKTLQHLEKQRLTRQLRAEHGQMLLWLGRDPIGEDLSMPWRASVTSQNMQTHLV